jgi:hypothetical protein
MEAEKAAEEMAAEEEVAGSGAADWAKAAEAALHLRTVRILLGSSHKPAAE